MGRREIETEVLRLSAVEAAAERRRARAAREVREARRARLALEEARKTAPRGRKGGEVRKSKAHTRNIPNGHKASKAKSKPATRTRRKWGAA